MNGIDALTGLPTAPSMRLNDAIQGDPSLPKEHEAVGRFEEIWDAFRRRLGKRGLSFDLEPDANNPSKVGWAVVFASDLPPGVREAVEPLIAHRRDHTKIPGDLLKVLEFKSGSTLDEWLTKLCAHRADVYPLRLGYYVLFIGGPESIPFEYQSELDVEYAVGRLDFDRPEDYRQYVNSVIAYETAATLPHSREVAFWGTRNRADRATQMSADCLVKPLFEGMSPSEDEDGLPPIATSRNFRSHCLLGVGATKSSLIEQLHIADPSSRPSFLFTASHGMCWPKGHENQRAQQGALLCQDWPGPGTKPEPGYFLTGADIDDDAKIHGLVAFLFACYGVGTPANDHFLADAGKSRVPIAERPFVAALPQRLLAHPGGGALAVYGHVERAWGYSIRPPKLGNHLLPFRNLMGRVLRGDPVGMATKDFSDRYSNYSVGILNQLAGTNTNENASATQMAALWIERNDAQNYILLGDPAVRLRVECMS
ncbi:MAG: hypothetical protein ACLQGP_05975 [Isosphaeraceae bacterium]